MVGDGVRRAGEGIVGGRRAVEVDADDLAVGGVEVLGELALGFGEVLTGGDEEVALAVGNDARAVVVGGGRRRVLDEDVLHVGERGDILREAAARRRGGGVPPPTGLA